MKYAIKILSSFPMLGIITIVFQFALATLGLSEIFAQDNTVCTDNLKEAEEYYLVGNWQDWQEAKKLITECLAEPNIPDSTKGKAYHLLGKIFIAEELVKEAKDAVRNLLIMVPNFEIDSLNDPPQLKSLIDDVAQQLVPTILSITPDSVEAESEGIIITVKGSDFVSGSKVQFNGMVKLTTQIPDNLNQLSAEIPAYDLKKVGEYEIRVYSPIQKGSKTSNAVKFTVTSSSSFPWTWIAIGGGAVAAAVVAVIVLGGDDDVPPEGTFPDPPTRP